MATTPTQILFPQNPLMRKLSEPMFEAEFDAAKSLGFTCHLFDEEALSTGQIDDALKRLGPGAGQLVLYRGWILAEERYRELYEALSKRSYLLVSSPSQYAEVSYFPNYYPKIRDLSPPAVWTDTADSFQAWAASRKLGDGPFLIKDHIKSAKHLWHEACFIPKNAGREQFEYIAENLRTEQGSHFSRGFVVKQYVPLRTRGEGPMEYPIAEEYRLFFWKTRLLTFAHYHAKPEQRVDFERFVELARRFDSPFFSMDIALTETDEWIVVDMGAGEVSALPPNLSAERFYSSLADALKY